MAQRNQFYVTAKKVINPKGQIFHYTSGKDIAIIATDELVYMADNDDTLILTSGGWQITAQESFADINTALSATNLSGS